MVQAKLVMFDEKGAETTRDLGEHEMVEVHYDSDPEGPRVCEVELTPRAYAPRCPEIRVNLNNGVSMTFDNADDVEDLLGLIQDAVNTGMVPFRTLAVARG